MYFCVRKRGRKNEGRSFITCPQHEQKKRHPMDSAKKMLNLTKGHYLAGN